MSCPSATTSTREIVTLGEEIEALVLQKEDKEGRLILSKKRAQYERAWGTIERVKEHNGVVTGPVIEVVKGGLILDIGLRGFLPASLVELRRVRDLLPYVGRTLEAKIIELDKHRNNVVLSRRAWLEETQKEQREEFLDNLKPGEIRKGMVSSVVNFGAFVDLGGMDGLVHVSELSWKHVDHPASVVAVGDEIEVQVLEVDLDRERISLSLKATQQDPWQEFANNHRVGELVYGRVTKLVPFGAFVQVGEGIEGLVHISEMAAHHVDLPEQVVTPGEELWVKIIDLDLQRRRISLSIKQAAEGGVVAAEYQEAFGEHAYDDQGNYIGDFGRGLHARDRGPGSLGGVRGRARWWRLAPRAARRRGPPPQPGRRAATAAGPAAAPRPAPAPVAPGPPPGVGWHGRRPRRRCWLAAAAGVPVRRPFVLFGFRLGARPIGDNSTFTHLRTGIDMARTGASLASTATPTPPPASTGWSRAGCPSGRTGGPIAWVASGWWCSNRRCSSPSWPGSSSAWPGPARRYAPPWRLSASARRPVDAPAAPLRSDLHGVDHHGGRAPAKSVAPHPDRVAVGEQPRLVPPRPGVAGGSRARRGDRLEGLAP